MILILTGLEVPVDDGAAVEVSEADADLVRDVGDLGLRQPLLQVHQDRVQRAAVAKLQEHLQVGRKGKAYYGPSATIFRIHRVPQKSIARLRELNCECRGEITQPRKNILRYIVRRLVSK